MKKFNLFLGGLIFIRDKNENNQEIKLPKNKIGKITNMYTSNAGSWENVGKYIKYGSVIYYELTTGQKSANYNAISNEVGITENGNIFYDKD